MAGNRYKRMPRFMGKDRELKMYLDQLSAEIEKGFLETDRVMGDDDNVSVQGQLSWFLDSGGNISTT